MRTSLRSSISPLLLALLLAAGACGDSGDTIVDGADAEDAAETVDTADAGEVDDSADPGESRESAEPADSDEHDDGGDAMSADGDLEAAISGWILSNLPYTSDQSDADCAASDIVGGIGAEQLAAAGITVENPGVTGADLTDDQGVIFVDALFDCIDMRQAFVDNITGPDLNEEDANCVVDEIGIDLIWEGTRTGLVAPEDADFDGFLEVVEAAGETCGVDMDQ